eukprot:TRINITY_DN1190_c0_g1_i1.p1 TRINITY_DN1190_c0_g1~~TRINITY_DN1190_c0_g1_i1.p1  ORF type:complete len:239 (+),score=136.57 TRINITY_DN1190_c0_g1_i1:102-719(+)
MSKYIKPVLITWGTFTAANGLSFCLQHPTQKLDWGFANRLFGREVNSEWWGTKAEHMGVITLTCAIADHASINLWNKVLLPKLGIEGPLSLAKTPVCVLLHGFTFAFTGIMAYIAYDALLNPMREGKRMEFFNSKVYPELRGCHAMWTLPVINGMLASKGLAVAHGTATGLIAPTLVFAMVKGFGATDWGNDGLTPFEKKLNGLV